MATPERGGEIISRVREFLMRERIDFREEDGVFRIPLSFGFGDLLIWQCSRNDIIIELNGEDWQLHGSGLAWDYGGKRSEATCHFIKNLVNKNLLFVEIRNSDVRLRRVFCDTEDEIFDELKTKETAYVLNSGKTYSYEDFQVVEDSPIPYKILLETDADSSGNGGTGAGKGEKVEDDRENTVSLIIDIDDFTRERKIQGIKIIRELTGLGLAEAKDFIENLPKTLRTTMVGSEEALLCDMRRAGLTVRTRLA
jgi:ribosomal protein L7/L12